MFKMSPLGARMCLYSKILALLKMNSLSIFGCESPPALLLALVTLIIEDFMTANVFSLALAWYILGRSSFREYTRSYNLGDLCTRI